MAAGMGLPLTVLCSLWWAEPGAASSQHQGIPLPPQLAIELLHSAPVRGEEQDGMGWDEMR